MNITNHYYLRAKERFGLNEQEAERLIFNATSRGKFYNQLPAEEKKYLSEKRNSGNCTPVYYQDKIFIFTVDFDLCLTVYRAPEWFGKRKLFENKHRIRNPKKYLRYSPTFAAGIV